jgi:hypothetical protein
MELIRLEELKGNWKSLERIGNDYTVDLCIKTNATGNYIIALEATYNNKNVGDNGITRKEGPAEIIPHPELEEEYILKYGETEHFIKAYTATHLGLDWGAVDMSFKKIVDFE